MSELDSYQLPQYPHFTIERLADGVYAALATTTGDAQANAGIVDLGGKVLIFDTTRSQQAAADLQAAATVLIGSAVHYVVNSHWHADHVYGNAAFPTQTVLISSKVTRSLIDTTLTAKMAQDRAQIADRKKAIQMLEKQLNEERDFQQQQILTDQINADKHQLKLVEQHKLRLPNCTFDHEMLLYGGTRAVELLTFGAGHTASDTILHIPDADVVFVGDLLFQGQHPWLGDGDLDAWPHVLDAISALKPKVVVSGQGPVATPADFALFIDYLRTVQQLASDVVQRGGMAQDADAVLMPASFSHLAVPQRFVANIRALVEQHL